MFLIDKTNNRINKVATTTFKELGFRERDNLQEWIANNPSCLNNESLLVIQKEFDGFYDTNERLDILALDKNGNLVIVENKLDDTGRDVTWQALKYAAYCSTLTTAEIINIFQEYLSKLGRTESAEEILSQFFENEDDYKQRLNSNGSQRIIFVAANFRKEVTSTVLWLMNCFGLSIQCFKATPFKLNDSLFLQLEQIIPMKEAEDYTIKMANKTREANENKAESAERFTIRRNFWVAMLAEMNKVSDAYRNVSPSKEFWLSTGAGISGVTFSCLAAKDYTRVEVWISNKSQEENKMIFDALYKDRADAEAKFGNKLVWERMDESKSSRVKYQIDDVSIFNQEDWPKMIKFMTTHLPKLIDAFEDKLKQISRKRR